MCFAYKIYIYIIMTRWAYDIKWTIWTTIYVCYVVMPSWEGYGFKLHCTVILLHCNDGCSDSWFSNKVLLTSEFLPLAPGCSLLFYLKKKKNARAQWWLTLSIHCALDFGVHWCLSWTVKGGREFLDLRQSTVSSVTKTKWEFVLRPTLFIFVMLCW